MKTFSFLFARARRELLLTTVVMTIAGLGASGLILLVNESLTRDGLNSPLLFVAFVGLALVIVATRTVGSYLLARIMARSLFELRLDLGRRLIGIPYKKFEEIGGDRALAAITSDINIVNSVLGGFPFFLRNLVVAICCFGYMLFISWQCFVIVLVFIAAGLTCYRLIVRRAARHQKASRQEWDLLFGHFRGLVGGIRELKLNASKRRDFIARVVEPSEQRFQREQLLGSTFFTAASSVSQTLTFIMIGIVLFVLPYAIDIPREVQVSYTLLLIYIITPFDSVVAWIPSLMNAEIAMARVEALGVSLGGVGRCEDSPPPCDPTLTEWTSLRLDGVTHTYYREKENDHFTLGPIGLTFKRGQITVIAGGNGSGKTTLAKVIAGLYAPEAGEIYVDDRVVTDALRESYCQNFSVVFSDFHLFEELLGLDEFDQETADHYLKKLQLDHKISIENRAFTNTKLSQGQRKRLALLSAYLEDRPAYIFDEWAADQDPQFKDVFYNELLPELKARGKTIIVISHDDKYFGVADQFVKLEYGQVEAAALDDARSTVHPARAASA